jgi:hypothetical protein
MKTNQWTPLNQKQKAKLNTNKYMNKIPRGEKQIKDAVNLIDKEVRGIVNETTDEDIKYEVGKAWGITKEYLNVK